jgi:hypothetical protein
MRVFISGKGNLFAQSFKNQRHVQDYLNKIDKKIKITFVSSKKSEFDYFLVPDATFKDCEHKKKISFSKLITLLVCQNKFKKNTISTENENEINVAIVFHLWNEKQREFNDITLGNMQFQEKVDSFDSILRKVNSVLEKRAVEHVNGFHYEMEDGDINYLNKEHWITFRDDFERNGKVIFVHYKDDAELH